MFSMSLKAVEPISRESRVNATKSISHENIQCTPFLKSKCCVYPILGVNAVDSISRKCCGLLLSFINDVD